MRYSSMRLPALTWISLLCVAYFVIGRAESHHSIGGEFSSEEVTVTGLVTELRLINPHTYIRVDIENGGNIEQWVLTFGPATKLIRGSGWTPETLVPGERITAAGRRARQGTGMYIAQLAKEDGTALITSLEE